MSDSEAPTPFANAAAATVQDAAPTPFANAAAATVQDAAPTPFANAAAATVQDAAPTPMSGIIGATISAALSSTPPEPSLEMASAAQASATTDAARPEGGTRHPPSKR
jgi:hypothetical protein